VVRPRPGAGRRHCPGQHQPGPDRPGPPAVPACGWPTHAAQGDGEGATEDTLAYFRDAEFRNYTLLELPHHGPLAGYAAAPRDYATTIVRNFLYSALMVLVWERLQSPADAQLAASPPSR
jgi:1,2-phenylacetyl-CoA epoxidase catalytic subunit